MSTDTATTGPSLSESPVCQEHTTRNAVGTCARCGRFVCEPCAGEKGVCSTCVHNRFLSIPSSELRARRATRFLTAHACIDAVSALLGVLALAMGQSDAITIVEGLAGLVLFVVAVSTIVTFLMWLHLAVRQTEALEINVGVTPGWAVGYWFIPFANLVKPYQTVRNLLNGLGGESLVSSARVSLWWALWIADNLFSQAETRLSMSGGLEAETSSAAHAVGLISSLLSIAGAILCIGIVRAAQQELDARRPPTG